VPSASPRLDPRLVDRLGQLARRDLAYAEIRRTLVARALELGIPPPSYEHVRRLTKQARLDRESESPILPIAIGVSIGTRHGNELLHAARRRGTTR
jgi:hypothetical protein